MKIDPTDYIVRGVPYLAKPVTLDFLAYGTPGIYGICDKWNDYHYVGETQCLRKRFEDHVYDSQQDAYTLAVTKWLQENCLSFHFDILETEVSSRYGLKDKLERLERESYWIGKLTAEGYQLQNVNNYPKV